MYSPQTLCEAAIAVIVDFYPMMKFQLNNQLPTNLLFGVYFEMQKKNQLCQLDMVFSDLDTLLRFLTELKGERNNLHLLFQSLVDHGSRLKHLLTLIFAKRCSTVKLHQCKQNKFKTIKAGLKLGTFLKEAGWFEESIIIFKEINHLYTYEETCNDMFLFNTKLEVETKLLSSYASFCHLTEANLLMQAIQEVIQRYGLLERPTSFSLAQTFMEFSQLYFIQSLYDEASKWSMEALRFLSSEHSVFVLVDVLRQAAKSSVVKREYKKAQMLIEQAMLICKKTFDIREVNNDYNIAIYHLKLSDLFIDYGFYLLNVDSISQSVRMYQKALQVREVIFGSYPDTRKRNLLIAMAKEDLSYAMYVHEYSSGNFVNALEHAEKAMETMQELLPTNHLLLASAKRVKALILEEIAIDHHDKSVSERFLEESQELHLSALKLAKEAFGEMNVQTAKHYGNLGRLYQSMRRYCEAEEMHLKAIQIKERLLGPNDYEVALSLGHLASLYNYDMGEFEKAEKLYIRSIEIGIKLFGRGYSGLEYDYRGLIRIYSHLDQMDKWSEFMDELHSWKQLRDNILSQTRDVLPLQSKSLSRILPQQIYDCFLALH